MVNDTTTLNGSLQECIDRLETNLQAMGVSDAEFDSETGILGLIDEIPNISPSVGGIELDTNITLDESNLETEIIGGVKHYKVYNNDRTTLTAYINALYDDTTVDMKGVLQGATVSYDLTQIGGEESTAISDNDGKISMVIHPTSLQDDMHYNVYMSFDGTGTDYKSCDELFRFMVRHDYVISFSQSEYVALNGECTIECTLTENGVGLSEAIVTLSDGTSFYSNITNQNGIATFSLTGLTSSATWTCSYSNVSDTCNVVVMNYLIYDDASVNNSSTLFGTSYALRNSGTNTTNWSSSGYYTVKTHTSGQRESMRELLPLTGVSTDFCLEYDSYAEQNGGTSGLVIYNSSTAWAKLTDNVNNTKQMWYAYNNGSFHETLYDGTVTTYQRWVHYKFTMEGNQFTILITDPRNGDATIWEHSETLPFNRGATTVYGLNSEWESNRTTRYKNLVAYEI